MKSLCFDIGGTLIYSSGEGLCLTVAEFTEKSLDELRPFFDEHFLTEERTKERAVKEFCDDLNISYIDVMNQIGEKQSTQTTYLYPDVEPTLKSIENREMVALSNTNPWYHTSLEDLGIADYFEHILYSYHIGVAKPDLRAYKEVEKLLNEKAENIVMIGDSSIDIKGAKQAGWSSIYLNRHNLQESTSYGEDHTIETLRELRPALESL